jgi:hypothetical protein
MMSALMSHASVDLTKHLDGTPNFASPRIGFPVSSEGTLPESELRLVSFEMTHMISFR